MSQTAFAVFDTPIGRCAIVWGENGIKALSLPEKSEASMRNRLLRRFPECREQPSPAAIASAVARIGALLSGARDDLADLVLDMETQPDFHRRVYELARGIPPGETKTYGDIASALGDKTLSRAVG